MKLYNFLAHMNNNSWLTYQNESKLDMERLGESSFCLADSRVWRLRGAFANFNVNFSLNVVYYFATSFHFKQTKLKIKMPITNK